MIVLVIYLFVIIIYALFKKVNAYDAFSRGVEQGFITVKNVFSTIFVLVLAINIFTSSGIIELLKAKLKFDLLCPEVFLQAILRPISSSSGSTIMIKIFETYGVDSPISKISSIIQGCNDTTIYIIALYFGSIKMKNVGKTLKIGLLNDVLTFSFALILCFLFYKFWG